jgi:acyl dehydratase
MNFAAELLFKTYRERWIKDSSLKVKFIKPVFNGDEVKLRGKVTGKENGTAGKTYIHVDIWAENRLGEKVMVGDAKIRL